MFVAFGVSPTTGAAPFVADVDTSVTVAGVADVTASGAATGDTSFNAEVVTVGNGFTTFVKGGADSVPDFATDKLGATDGVATDCVDSWSSFGAGTDAGAGANAGVGTGTVTGTDASIDFDAEAGTGVVTDTDAEAVADADADV